MTKPLICVCLCAGLLTGPALAQSGRQPIERAAVPLETQRLAIERARAAVEEAERASKAARRLAASAARAAKAAKETAEAARRAAAAEAWAAMSGRQPEQRDGHNLLRVGPTASFRRPSEAAEAARDGDVIEIAAGAYEGDAAVWRAHILTIRGIGGRAHLKAARRVAEDKAIWVIKGDNTVLENIEFSEAEVRHRNGAGIRLEGAGLTIRNGYFHDNQVGILTGPNPRSDIVIENSEFRHNVYKGEKYYAHNIYIGRVRSFTLRNSYVHHASIGHNVKSRAATNRIEYNRLMDHHDGNSSYLLDLPNGGAAYIVGNVIQQSRHTDNSALINFASHARDASDRLYIANNTLVSERPSANFVRNHSPATALLINNVLAGRGEPVVGPARLIGNLVAEEPGPQKGVATRQTMRARRRRAAERQPRRPACRISRSPWVRLSADAGLARDRCRGRSRDRRQGRDAVAAIRARVPRPRRPAGAAGRPRFRRLRVHQGLKRFRLT